MNRSLQISSFARLPKIEVAAVAADFERQSLRRPFGFKGGALHELWQTCAVLVGRSGRTSVGAATQNVLWAEPRLLGAASQTAADALMFAVTDHALHRLPGRRFESPAELIEAIYPAAADYARRVTGLKDVKPAFVLNALVAVDHAAHLLWAAENGTASYDDFIPPEFRPLFNNRRRQLAAVPLVSYDTPSMQIKRLIDEGYRVLKIKLGRPGSQDKMLRGDRAALQRIQRIVADCEPRSRPEGDVFFYFDANQRYETKETLFKLLDTADRLGILSRTLLLEEPFPEEPDIDVSDLPVRVAADERVTNIAELHKAMELGYGALALKPIAKTLSRTLPLAAEAVRLGIPCFCADLTVHPLLVEWNKNFAVRLPAFPGLGDMGLLESNGRQLYRRWTSMMGRHPRRDARWVEPKRGVYELDDAFFSCSGGIFESPPHEAAVAARLVSAKRS